MVAATMMEPTMSKLTDRQLVILSTAMKRDDGAVLPLPEMNLNKAACTMVLKSLLKHGLVAEAPAAAGAEVWREADDGDRFGLHITAAGLDAMGIDPADRPALPDAAAQVATPAPAGAGRSRSARKRPPAANTASKPGKRQPPSQAANVRPGTKQAQLIDLLRRKKGASLDEIMAATGWQAHSVRGAISGLVTKKLGLPVDSEVTTGRGRVYRIVEAGQ